MRSLQLKKKRDQNGLILLEGYRLVLDALENGFNPKRILVSPKFDSSLNFEKVIETARKNNIKEDIISLVTEELLSTVTDTVNSQGIVAAFVKPLAKSFISCHPVTENPLIVVLDGVADPGNAGTIIRSAFGLGATAVVGIQSCDLWSPKVLRSSMGTSLRFPVLECSWLDAPALLQEHFKFRRETLQVFVADGSESSHISFTDVDYCTRPSVLLIGSEAFGPSENISRLCDGDSSRIARIRIPMTRPVESFNAGVAASIILAEAAKQREAKETLKPM